MARARVGVNLGISPTHARSVALVLSLKTGLASPQFHVKHDDLFETTSRQVGGYRMPPSRWQGLSGFDIHQRRILSCQFSVRLSRLICRYCTVLVSR
jgi:hypothetical protein